MAFHYSVHEARVRRGLIFALRHNGLTYVEIGRLFGFSRERARSIVISAESRIESQWRRLEPMLWRRGAAKNKRPD